MDEKKCKNCGKTKPLSEYYLYLKNGSVFSDCKECVKLRVKNNPNNEKYYKTEKGVIRTIYKTQKMHSKSRGHPPPSYTKEQLKQWLYDNGFGVLYDNWKKSGYENLKKPSVDRVDSTKPYTLFNIRLVTWKENRKAQALDILTGTGSSGKRCKAVLMLDDNGCVLNRYVSLSDARRQHGFSMWRPIKTGIKDRVIGRYWCYESDYDERLKLIRSFI